MFIHFHFPYSTFSLSHFLPLSPPSPLWWVPPSVVGLEQEADPTPQSCPPLHTQGMAVCVCITFYSVCVTYLVFSHALWRCPATCTMWVLCCGHSVLASLVHSSCTSATDPLSDLEGVRRAASGECDMVVCLFVCWLSVSCCTLCTHVSVCIYIYYI